MKIEIIGTDAILATEELLTIQGLEGSYETVNEVEREALLTTIATIVGIVGGSITIAERLHKWSQKYQQSSSGGAKIEKVLIVAPNGKRLLLKDATVAQIQAILEEK
jgi:hypothetical protein